MLPHYFFSSLSTCSLNNSFGSSTNCGRCALPHVLDSAQVRFSSLNFPSSQSYFAPSATTLDRRLACNRVITICAIRRIRS